MKKIRLFLQALLITILFIPFTANAEEINFKPVNYYGDFKLDSHYIIAVHNTSNGNWYALASGENGEALSVKISDPTNGLKIDKSKIKTENYIFVCSKRDDYNMLKLRTNILDEETGKKYSLYIGNDQMFNLGGGTLYFSHNSYNPNNYFRIGRSNTRLMYNSDTNEFYYSDGRYYSGTDVLILSDVEPMIHNGEPKELKKVKGLQRMYVATDHKKYDAFQLVYRAEDGNNYILTSSGTKKVNITNEKFTTDDYLYFDDDNSFHYEGPNEYGAAYTDAHLVSNDKYVNISSNGVFSDYYDTSYKRIRLYFQKRYRQVDYIYPIEFFTDPIFIEDKMPTVAENNRIFDEMHRNETMRYKLNQGDYFVGWDNTNKKFIPVTNIDDGVMFDYYTSKIIYELTNFAFYDLEDNYKAGGETYADALPNENYFYYLNDDEILLGWTDEKSKAGYIEKEEWENLYVYSEKYGTIRVNDNIINKYAIKEKFSDCKKTNGVVNLYPVLTKKYNIIVNPIIYGDRSPIIGVSDWKNNQEGKTEEYLAEHEKNQGSINIEVYKDGKIWFKDGKVYFRYNNDNAADLNIKFMPNNLINTNEYLTNPDVFEKSPDKYVIVGVYTEQGNSEEGLYERFNWMSEDGGQLDNVKGGSTVKIYLSTKYTSKYYLNDKLYKADELIYTPTATKNAIEYNSRNSKYIVNYNSNNTLLNKTDDITFFKKDNLGRGEYSTFSYEISKERDTMDVLNLPKQKLAYKYWIVKDEDNKVVGKAKENEVIKIESKDKVNFLYVGGDDSIDTIHLYAYTPGYKNTPKVPKNTPVISVKKGILPEIINPKTGSKVILIILIIITSFGIGFYQYKKKESM